MRDTGIIECLTLFMTIHSFHLVRSSLWSFGHCRLWPQLIRQVKITDETLIWFLSKQHRLFLSGFLMRPNEQVIIENIICFQTIRRNCSLVLWLIFEYNNDMNRDEVIFVGRLCPNSKTERNMCSHYFQWDSLTPQQYILLWQDFLYLIFLT